jgi:glutamate synthase domain-containing protein 2
MRKQFVWASVISVITLAILSFFWQPAIYIFIAILVLAILGFYDFFQTSHTIRRNYPLLGRLRYILESFRPEMQQYFVERDTDGTPFNRLQRSLIYARSKKQTDTVPFGTQLNIYGTGYEWINHSINALDHHTLEDNPRVKIGGSACKQPYFASIFNISAMSYGSLSSNAIIALNQGAAKGGFYHNTGEGGLSHYHLENGGDVVWNIGTGYFSTRNPDGTFSEKAFKERSNLPQVKMIEIKFSQGAKPGHGGILPKEKVTDEIAKIRMVDKGHDVISPPHHTAFTNPNEFVDFVAKLRELSGGKPIGFKICIGKKSEFLGICKAMVEKNTFVDFITVDGGEGGTGAAPLEFSDHVGMPLRDAIAFVYDALVGFGIKKEIKIICSGKIASGFDIVKSLAIGADLCNSARGMMFALGCIQALKCNTNTCPTGVATQKPHLVAGLDIPSKTLRVASYHAATVKSAIELMAAGGISHPDAVDRSLVYRRVDATRIETFEETYPEMKEGTLLVPSEIPPMWEKDMARANAHRF